MKKHLRLGDIQKNHFQELDKFAVSPNERRSKSKESNILDSLKPADLLKMISTPVEKQRSKSYYLGPQPGRRAHGDEIKNLGFHSVRIDQKRRSASKGRKDKSLEKDNSYNNSKFFKAANKSHKKVGNGLMQNKSINKCNNKSNSKKKSPKKKYEIEEDSYVRPRAQTQKNKMVKKSHQGSYMIGADSGADWPL
jgi:hypothetical protein